MFRHWSQGHHSAAGADGGEQTLRALVEGCLPDAGAVSRLRNLAAELGCNDDLSRCDDHQLVDLVATALVAGRLHPAAQEAPALRPLRSVAGRPTSMPPPSRSSTPRAAGSALSPAADGPFEAGLDIAAQVDSLQRAARAGVPFCEECARVVTAAR